MVMCTRLLGLHDRLSYQEDIYMFNASCLDHDDDVSSQFHTFQQEHGSR